MVEAKPISSNMEDYLKTIALLTEDYGFARAVDVATRLQVKMPSVSRALKKLSESGLIIYHPSFPVRLTEDGKERAELILQKHQILKHFFIEILCCPEERADSLACRIEHEVNEHTVYAFSVLQESIKKCPTCSELLEHLRAQLASFDKYGNRE